MTRNLRSINLTQINDLNDLTHLIPNDSQTITNKLNISKGPKNTLFSDLLQRRVFTPLFWAPPKDLKKDPIFTSNQILKTNTLLSLSPSLD